MRRIILCLLTLLMISGLSSANSIKLVDGQALIYDNSNHVIYTFGDTNNTYFSHLAVIDNVAIIGGDGGLYTLDINNGKVIQEWPGGGSAGQVTAISYSAKKLAVKYEYEVEMFKADNPRNLVTYAMVFLPWYAPIGEVELKNNILYTDTYKYDVSTGTPRCINPGAQVFMYDNKGTWAAEILNVGHSPDIIGFGWKGVEPIVGDWDGDGFENVGIYNRAGNNFLVQTPAGFDIIGLGWAGVTPIIGDYDGDGDDDVGVYDNHGTWALSTNSGFKIVGFGWSGTEPVVGDWNGDGTDEVGVYNRAGNNWLVRLDNNNMRVIGLGWPGVKTLVGNIDTDRQDEVLVYDPASAVFVSNDGYQKTFGVKNSQPILGDINHNGACEIGAIYPDGTVHYNVPQNVDITLVRWKGATAIAV